MCIRDSLNFQKLKISTSGPIRRPNLRHRTKFREDRSNRSRDMDNFWLVKMAAAAILDFKLLTIATLKRVELRVHAKFCRNRSNRGWHMAIFQFARWRPSAILDFQKLKIFNFRSHSEAQYAYQISRRSVEPFRRYGWFSILKMAAVSHLVFKKLKILTSDLVRKPNMRHHTKFRENGSNRFRDMADFRFQDGGRPPSWICKSWNF